MDIWHANSQGIYSAVQDLGTMGKKFLRGYQVTDHNGTARFTTIYPGWYQGRTIHIHVKVRTFEGSNKTLEWTSQFYSDNSINKVVHTQPPYSKHGPPTITNEQDGIYTGASTDDLLRSNSGQHLLLNLTKDGQSYLGTAVSTADWDYHELMKGHDAMITVPKELVQLFEALDK